MKKFLTALLILTLAVSLCGCCLKHQPGPEATCTEPQICLKCDKVLAEALGHEPGAEATCTEDQLCLRCGEVLAPTLGHTPGAAPTCTEAQTCTVCGEVVAAALGHQINDNGQCTVCGEQITDPGVRYNRPGAGGMAGDSDTVVPETRNSGHYDNNIAAYYANAVLVCGDYGIEYFTPDPTGSSAYAGIVNDFAARYPQLNVTSLLVPKCAAYETPSGYAAAHDSIASFISSTYAMMDSHVHTADAMSVMDSHAGEYMFYRTDHHWTSLGAYYASVAYCEANGITPCALDSYDSVVRTGVTGSLYMYSGNDSHLAANPDYTVCRFPQTGYTMQYLSGGSWYNGLAVNGENRGYAYAFMCGDNPLTVIKTDNHNGRTLMVFKESYGNAFAPYMIDYYEQVIVVDIRETTDSVAALIDRYGVTDALIINNVQAATSLQSSLRNKVMS